MIKRYFQHIKDTLLLIDNTLQILDALVTLEFTSKSTEELIGQPLQTVLPVNACDNIIQLIKNKADTTVQMFGVLEQGSVVQYQYDYVPDYNSGKHLLIISNQMEVLNLKKTLQETHDSLLTLIENVPYSLIITRLKDGQILYMNHHLRRQFGIPNDGWSSLEIIHQFVHEEDHNTIRDLLRKDSVVANYEAEMYDYNHKPFFASLSSRIIQFQGEAATITTIINTTARKRMEDTLLQSEAKYRILAENVEDIIWRYNLTKNHFTYVSPSVQKLRGITVKHAMMETMEETLAPESYQKVQQMLQSEIPDFLQNPKPRTYRMHVEQVHKDGHLVQSEVSVKVQLEDNEIILYGVSRINET